MQQPQIPVIESTNPLDNIYSLGNFQQRHKDILTLSQLKWLLRFREKNGLSESGAVIMIARKFYIDETLFAAWLADQKA